MSGRKLMSNPDLIDLFAILTAGGRNNGEKSNAKPASYYRDPAESVKFLAEIEREKKLKSVRKEKAKKKRKQSKAFRISK